MIQRLAISLAVIVLGTVGIVAQLPAPFENWQYSAAIDVTSVTSPGLASVVVPGALGARARQDLADLRVVDDRGTEVPFVLRARRGGVSAVWRAARVLDPGYSPDRYSEVTLDLGAAARIHNRLRLTLESSTDFLTWIEIATGPDARTWTVVRERAPIYDLRQAGMGQSLEATYPDSTARHVRVRILDGTRPHIVRSAEVAHEVVTNREVVPGGVTLAPADAGPKRSAWVSRDDAPQATLSEVRFETSRPLFDRPVSVETSGDGQAWRSIASGEIYRHTSGGVTQTSLTVSFPETASARWRVLVYNHDDAPIADLQPALYATPRRVVFSVEPGRSYRLLFGNARAAAPVYEMVRLMEAADLDAATPATLGAEQINAAYRDPRPWSERNPWVLWAALGLAVVVLGGLAVRTLRGST